MSDVFDKCIAWKDYRLTQAAGLYPYYRPIEASFDGTEVQMAGRRVVMAGSNNYLGLATDPRVKEAAQEATRRFGTTCSGSRLLNGTLALHEALEEELAVFLKREMALVISTGFQTNLAALSALCGRHDVVFSDRQNHASLVDGLRLGFATERRYRHSDLQHLEQLLCEAPPDAGKLIVTDGVFSMEGDLCDLAGLTRLAKKYGARLLVDDAHGLGVLGHGGRGTGEHLGFEAETDLLTGTFSKSFASLGGVVAGRREVVNYIKHKARPLIFSASMTPGAVAAARKSLEIVQAEPERRARLFEIAEKMHHGLRAMGFDTGVSVTPIVPVLVGDQVRCFRFWKALFEQGVFANPVIPPAVEPGRALIRTSYMATHTDEQLERVLGAFERVGHKLGVLPSSRPSTFQRVPVARPGTGAIAALPERRENGALRGQRLAGRNVAHRLFDAVETATYRAVSLQPEDWQRWAAAPRRLWMRRSTWSGLLIDAGASLLIKNGKTPARS